MKSNTVTTSLTCMVALPRGPRVCAYLPAATRAGTGNRPVRVVPCPGWERMARVPPSAASRSAIPCRPVPYRAVAVSNLVA